MFWVAPTGLSKLKKFVTFVGTAQASAASGTTLVVTLPGGVLSGDKIYVFGADAGNGQGNLTSVSTDYSEIGDAGVTGITSNAFRLFSKTAGESEGNPTLNFTTGSGAKFGVVVVYRDVAREIVSTATQANSGILATLPNYNDNAGIVVAAFWMNHTGVSNTDISFAPSGWNVRQQLEGDSVSASDRILSVYDRAMTGLGSTNDTQEYSLGTNDHGMFTVEVLAA